MKRIKLTTTKNKKVCCTGTIPSRNYKTSLKNKYKIKCEKVGLKMNILKTKIMAKKSQRRGYTNG